MLNGRLLFKTLGAAGRIRGGQLIATQSVFFFFFFSNRRTNRYMRQPWLLHTWDAFIGSHGIRVQLGKGLEHCVNEA